MKIACVGGGPAGLSFAALMKRRDKEHEITVLERNRRGSTYGWGVTYWQPMLDQLYESDPETANEIRAHSYRWADSLVDVQGRQTVIRGGHGFSISRRRLLDILTRRAVQLGVDVQFEREVQDPNRLPDADLIVACDGVNSHVRRARAESFGTDVVEGRNKYVWLGTRKVFDAFTFAFAETDAGWVWFYAYGFDGRASTVIVECSPETWTGLSLHTLGAEDSVAVLGRIFERQLDGHPLLNGVPHQGGAFWLNFPTVTNERWHHDNIVLMGDSAHTTHYSIGSGTILALEDAIGLADKLCGRGDLGSALEAYEKERKHAIVPLQGWARYSAQWYESLPRYIHLQPPEFTALLRERRSPILPHVPPLAYYQLHRMMQGSAGLQKFRELLGPTVVRAALNVRTGQRHLLSGRRSTKSIRAKLLQTTEEWDVREEILSRRMADLIDTYSAQSATDGLEIGCQNGALTDLVKRMSRVHVWTGIDPKLTADRVTDGGCILHPARACGLDFPDRTFDVALFANVFEHIPPHERDVSLREIFRVLKPGGVVIGQLPNPYFPIESHSRLPFMGWLPDTWQHRYWKLSPVHWEHDFYVVTIKDLTRIAQREGFDVVHVRNFNYPPEVIPHGARWAARLLERPMRYVPWSWQFVLVRPTVGRVQELTEPDETSGERASRDLLCALGDGGTRNAG